MVQPVWVQICLFVYFIYNWIHIMSDKQRVSQQLETCIFKQVSITPKTKCKCVVCPCVLPASEKTDKKSPRVRQWVYSAGSVLQALSTEAQQLALNVGVKPRNGWWDCVQGNGWYEHLKRTGIWRRNICSSTKILIQIKSSNIYTYSKNRT